MEILYYVMHLEFKKSKKLMCSAVEKSKIDEQMFKHISPVNNLHWAFLYL